jgi:Fe-S-cluster-containing hydrogenase component 2
MGSQKVNTMIYIKIEKCTGCGACASICPQQAISIKNDAAIIDYARCNRCGDCTGVCPVGAIYTSVPIYAQSKRGGDLMRGRDLFGPVFDTGRGMGAGQRYHRGWGRGNPYPYCRLYPWQSRRWWAYGLAVHPYRCWQL